MMAGSAVLARLTYERLGLLSVAVVLVAFGLSGWVFWESSGRYAHSAGRRRRTRDRSGRSGAALMIAVIVSAMVAMVDVLA